MAITPRSPDSHAVGTGGTATLSEPTGTSQGDMLVCLAACDKTVTFTPPRGWFEISGQASASQFRAYVLYTLRGASAPNLTFTLSATAYREIYIVAYKPGTASNIVAIDATSINAGIGTTSSNTHSPDPPAVTAVASATRAIAVAVNWAGSGTNTWTASTNYAVDCNNTAGNDGVMESRALAASGQENPGTITSNLISSSNDFWDGFTFTLVENTPAADPGIARPWTAC